MSGPDWLDSAWIAANPLPVHGQGTTKNSRGRVVAIGSGRAVPGAIRLTAEAALRTGAGKVQVACPASLGPLLGVAMPEAGVVGLPEDGDGEIGEGATDALANSLRQCDAVVVGPGIATPGAAERLLSALLPLLVEGDGVVVLDAAVVAAAGSHRERLRAIGGRLVMTPHHGEMAAFRGCSAEDVSEGCERIAREVAEDLGGTVALKDSHTHLATADGRVLRFPGGGVGLATGGSGDVLAGAIAGLAARGASAEVAAGWGVWLHGKAARALAGQHSPIGFLARELLPELPPLMPQ